MTDQTTIAPNNEELDTDVTVTKEETTIEPKTFQKFIYRKEENTGPLKVNLKISELPNEGDIEEIDIEQNIEEGKNEMNKLGQVGVFFAEILGSLVGLAYGAAAHLNNMVQGTTPQSS